MNLPDGENTFRLDDRSIATPIPPGSQVRYNWQGLVLEGELRGFSRPRGYGVVRVTDEQGVERDFLVHPERMEIVGGAPSR